MKLALVVALAALAALAACTALEPDTSEDFIVIDVDVLDVPIKEFRSVMITESGAMNALGDRLPLGVQLKRLGKRTITEWAPERGQRSRYPIARVNEWVEHPFRAAAGEFAEHNARPFDERVGMRIEGNPWIRLQKLWPQLNGNVGGGPFRLLAVVNRLDLAGDVDERGLIDAAKLPRNFGEARLIFGLVDRDYEKKFGQPYPMTFIIEYRLPALDADFNPIDDYDYRGNLFDREEWRTQMARWGKMWRQLSAWDQTGSKADVAAFRAHLDKVVNRFARPENFTALRANARLARRGTVEFELREWYMLRNNQWVLIPRKPRDEPYNCIADGGDLARLIDHFWDGGKKDLRMDRLTPSNPVDVVGFNIPRSVSDAPIGIGDPSPGCPRAGGVPTLFEMEGTDGNGTSRFTAPFGRVRENFVWEVKNASETRRHQFAIRTCTGCHSKEAGVFGFHVAPRLRGKQSKLSSFLTGGAGVAFTHNGKSYDYDEMALRKAFLSRAAERDPNLRLFDGLYRDDER